LPVNKSKKKAEKKKKRKEKQTGGSPAPPHYPGRKAGPWVKCEPCGGHPCVQLFLRPTARRSNTFTAGKLTLNDPSTLQNNVLLH